MFVGVKRRCWIGARARCRWCWRSGFAVAPISTTSGAWFAKPLKLYGSNLGYTYTQFDEAKRDRPITANDLVEANGACPRYVAPAPAATGWSRAGRGWPGVPMQASLHWWWHRYRHERMRYCRAAGPAHGRQHRQGSRRRSGGGADFPKRPTARGLSFRRRPAYGNGSRGQCRRHHRPSRAKKKMVKKKPDKTKGLPKPGDKT